MAVGEVSPPAADASPAPRAAPAAAKPTAALWLDQGCFLTVTLFQLFVCASKHGSGAGPTVVLLLMATGTGFVMTSARYWPNRCVPYHGPARACVCVW